VSREEDSTGFTAAEKLFALLIILIGAIIIYATTNSPSLIYPIFFNIGGIALITLGIFMILAKTQ